MGQDTYTLVDTIKYPNMVVRVFRPILTDEERNRRMEAIRKSAENLLKEQERTLKNKKQKGKSAV